MERSNVHKFRERFFRILYAFCILKKIELRASYLKGPVIPWLKPEIAMRRPPYSRWSCGRRRWAADWARESRRTADAAHRSRTWESGNAGNKHGKKCDLKIASDWKQTKKLLFRIFIFPANLLMRIPVEHVDQPANLDRVIGESWNINKIM